MTACPNLCKNKQHQKQYFFECQIVELQYINIRLRIVDNSFGKKNKETVLPFYKNRIKRQKHDPLL